MNIQSLPPFVVTIESITQHCYKRLIGSNCICTVTKMPLCVMRVPTTWYKWKLVFFLCLICPDQDFCNLKS
jgi:hypothetical protein